MTKLTTLESVNLVFSIKRGRIFFLKSGKAIPKNALAYLLGKRQKLGKYYYTRLESAAIACDSLGLNVS